MQFARMLTGFLSLREDEKRSFPYLFLISLITGIGLSFFFVAVNTFLIQKTSVSNLPYAYIISGLGGFLLIKVYQYRQRKEGIIRSYLESVILFFLITLAIFFAFNKYGSDARYATLMAYAGFLFNMPFTIIFSLGLSALCARLYNISQSKRLLALVGTGEIFASILGYLIAPVISKAFGSSVYLLPLAGVCILPALLLIQRLFIAYKSRLDVIPITKTGVQTRQLTLNFFVSDPFYSLIAAVTTISVAAIYFVDYSYLISVRYTANYSGLEIAYIVSIFFSLVKVGELVFSFLSGKIITSRGIKFSMLLLPAILSGCFLLSSMDGLVFKSDPVFILAFIFLAKWAERVIRKGITTPATKVLYQVTHPAERLQIEANIEGLLNQAATVITGIILLIFSAVFAKSDTLVFIGIVSLACFVLFLVWYFLSLKLYENYKKKIWLFLNELKPASSEQSSGTSAGLPVFSAEENLLITFNRALEAVNQEKKSQALDTLCIYTPSLLNHLNNDNDLIFKKRLISSYYSNDNFFYRLLVIRYFQAGHEKLVPELFKELWEVSDLTLRAELLSAFNKNADKLPESELYYFETLCEEYINELILALAAEHDLKEISDSELQAELKRHTQMILKVVFGLLKTLYDPSAIQVIYEIITKNEEQDMENRLFALELLDNTLNENLKHRLIPVFEPVPFEQKINKFQQFVPVVTMQKDKRLKELLMKDFKLVNSMLKELCLTWYYKLSSDTSALKAFSESSIGNLRSNANELLNFPDTDHHKIKKTFISEIGVSFDLNQLQRSYLYNLGLEAGRKHKAMGSGKSTHVNPYSINIGGETNLLILDCCALAILVDHNQSGA